MDGNGEFKVFDRVGTPDWSPNSAELVVSPGGSVTVIDSDGTHPRPITTAHSPGNHDFGARWSPDGGSLVFGRNYGDEDEDTGISVVTASGGQPTALTFVNSDNDGEDELPDWQPLNPR